MNDVVEDQVLVNVEILSELTLSRIFGFQQGLSSQLVIGLL